MLKIEPSKEKLFILLLRPPKEFPSAEGVRRVKSLVEREIVGMFSICARFTLVEAPVLSELIIEDLESVSTTPSNSCASVVNVTLLRNF